MQIIKKNCGMMGGLKEAGCIKVLEMLCSNSPEQCVLIKAQWDRSNHLGGSLEKTLKVIP